MAKFCTTGVEIMGIQTCVPKRVIHNRGILNAVSSEEVERIVKMAVVEERHIAEEGVCTSDLCIEAAEALIQRLNWARDSVDLLVFVTQTPDYFMPSSACVLQNKLSLSQECAAFDINLGCSAYPYGLATVSKMMQGGAIRRALLLVGETPSKVCHPSDRSTFLIFGDVGSATALEVTAEACDSHFVLRSDGGGGGDFIVPAGGFRDRFSTDHRKHFISMNGPGIFAFDVTRKA